MCSASRISDLSKLPPHARRNLELILAACSRLGLVKESFSPRRLLLDFDGRLPARMLERIWHVSRTAGLTIEWIRFDRTQHGFHVVVQIQQRLEPWQVLALQAICGSDYRREALNWFRLSNMPANSDWHRRNWNILYERKIYEKANTANLDHVTGRGSGKARNGKSTRRKVR